MPSLVAAMPLRRRTLPVISCKSYAPGQCQANMELGPGFCMQTQAPISIHPWRGATDSLILHLCSLQVLCSRVSLRIGSKRRMAQERLPGSCVALSRRRCHPWHRPRGSTCQWCVFHAALYVPSQLTAPYLRCCRYGYLRSLPTMHDRHLGRPGHGQTISDVLLRPRSERHLLVDRRYSCW